MTTIEHSPIYTAALARENLDQALRQVARLRITTASQCARKGLEQVYANLNPQLLNAYERALDEALSDVFRAVEADLTKRFQQADDELTEQAQS